MNRKRLPSRSTVIGKKNRARPVLGWLITLAACLTSASSPSADDRALELQFVPPPSDVDGYQAYVTN